MKLTAEGKKQEKEQDHVSLDQALDFSDLYRVMLEEQQAEQKEDEQDEAVINLLDLAAVCRQHGMPEALRAVADENGQLASYLGLDLDRYESDEERGQAVADAIRGSLCQSEQKTDDTTEGSMEFVVSISSLIGAIITGLSALFVVASIIKFIKDIVKEGKTLYDAMKDLRDKKLSDRDRIDEEHFRNEIQSTMLPPDKNEERLKGFSKLGDHLVAAVTDENTEADRDKIVDYLHQMGYEMSVEDDDVTISLRDDFEMKTDTMGGHGWSVDDFIKWYDHTMEAVKQMVEYGDTMVEHYENKKDEAEKKAKDRQEETEKELSDEELKKRKQQAKLQKQILKYALKKYFNTAVQEAQNKAKGAKAIRLKEED